MKILLAIDHSASSQTAVREVAARNWPSGSSVCVLNVVEPPPLVVIPSLVQTAIDAAQALVKTAGERLSAVGLAVSTRLIQGNPRVHVIEYSEDWGADLIVVGSHGQNALTRFLMGSVAQSCIRGAKCAVEVVRTTISDRPVDQRAMRILLATDGSDCSVAAAHSVADRPWPEESTVRVISVAEVITPAIEPWYTDARILETLREDATTQARDAAMAAEAVVSAAGLRSNGIVLTGIAKGAIVDEAESWRADLVVLGSHGLRGVKRLLIGSVAEAVALHARCSIEVIRRRSAEEQ